jgi:lanthionine synthetase-like protein
VTALWGAEHHDRLAGGRWDPNRARNAIAAICHDAEAAFDPDALWPAHPLDGEVDDDERRSLYLGAAGMAWALDRLARAGVHEPRRAWDEVAGGLAAAPARSPSLLLGAAGVLLVSWLLAPSPDTADRLAEEIAANAANPTNELLWGSAGTMLAASVMLDRTGDPRFAGLWRDSAERLLAARDEDGAWTQDLYGETRRFLGAAHGFAGNAHALLQRRRALADPASVGRSVAETAIATAVERDGLANWPPEAGGALVTPSGEVRTQWCHGAPGMITSLAAAEPGDAGLTRALVAGGELVWRAGPLRKGPGLCHGTAGNGFALLALFHRTGDEIWLERARAFALHAAAQAEQGRGRYSLWTGDIGAAVLLERCLTGAERGFPTLDAW